MSTIYDKIDLALKEIRRIQDLIRQGIARPEEKNRAFDIAKEASSFFTDETFKRRAEKISKITIWTNETHDGFVSSGEADQLNNWIDLFEEFKDKRKIKSELSNENVHIESVVDGEDQHIFITKKGSKEHTHLILDGGTGEIRVDPKDQSPHEMVKSVEAKIELNTGDAIRTVNGKLDFVEPEAPSVPRGPILDFSGGSFPHQSNGSGRKIFPHLANLGDTAAFNIKLSIQAQDASGEELSPESVIPPIQPNSQTTTHIFFDYTALTIAKKKLINPLIIFSFQDGSGHRFESSRTLIQELRADGEFNIKAGPDFLGCKHL